MNKTVILIAVVLTCSIVTVASAIVVNQPLNQGPNPTENPTNPPILTKSTPTATRPPATDFPTSSATQSTSTQTPPSVSSSSVQSPTITPEPSVPLENTKQENATGSGLFNAEFEYLFVSATNRTDQHHDHFGFGFNSSYTYYPVEMVLNLTYRGNPENEPYDIKIEGYQINFEADTGATENYIGYFGTNLNQTFEPASQTPTNLPFIISQLGLSGFSLRLNLTSNESILGKQVFSRSDSGKSRLGVWSNGAPNAIIVTLQRVGCIVFNEGSASFFENQAKDVILQQVQLERGEDGFFYNRILG